LPEATAREVVVGKGTLASPSLEQTKNVTFGAQVLQVVELSLVDQSGPFDPLDTVQALNFGTLTQNETGVFDVLVRSNTGYDVTFQFDNSGVTEIRRPSDTSTVPYSDNISVVVTAPVEDSVSPFPRGRGPDDQRAARRASRVITAAAVSSIERRVTSITGQPRSANMRRASVVSFLTASMFT
jgi:hypothetical protein